MDDLKIGKDSDLLLWRVSTQNDRDAFKCLFEVYYSGLCLYAKRFIDDLPTREDIVQDAFFYLWEKRKSIVIDSSPKYYLIAIVRNLCLNYLQRETRHLNYEKNITPTLPLYVNNIDEVYNAKELKELLLKVLDKLPEEYRVAFVMSRMENKSTQEIAQEMGVTVRSVERYRAKAIELLRAELKDYLPLFFLLIGN